MSGKKFCRLCLNEVFVASSNMHSSHLQTKDILMSIFPEMNISLTKIIRLCEECFQKVNFVSKMNEGFLGRKESTQCCKLGFTFIRFSNIFFDENNNYPNEAFKEEWTTALTKPNCSPSNGPICGICLSWIKKISQFKRQCLNTEESLQFYCSRRNLTVLGDADIQNFLNEQYFLRTELPCSDSALKLESTEMHNELTESLNEPAALPIDLGAVYHEEYFQVTGEVFSNLDKNSSSVGNNVNFEQNGENCSSQDLARENDVVLVLEDDDTSSEGKIEVDDELNLYDTSSKISEDLKNFETDDVFIDHGIRNSSSVPTIVLDDDDDRNILKTEETVRNVQHYQTEDRASSTSTASQDRTSVGSNEQNCCGPYSDIGHCSLLPNGDTSDTIEETCTHVNEVEACIVRKAGVNEIVHCPNHVNQLLQPRHNLGEEDTSCSALSNDQEDPVLLNSSYEFYYNSFYNNNEYFTENHATYNEDSSTLDFVYEEALINNRNRFRSNDVIVIDDDGFEIFENTSDTIDLTSDDTFFEHTQDVERRELYGERKLWGCYICVAVLDDKKSMRKHLLNHEEPQNKYGKFKCSRCPFRARCKGSVTRHEYYHSNKFHNRFAGKKLRYTCPYCNIMYLDKGGIKSHMNDHIISRKEYQCADCLFTTKLSLSLKSHYQKYHYKRRDPSFYPKVSTDVN